MNWWELGLRGRLTWSLLLRFWDSGGYSAKGCLPGLWAKQFHFNIFIKLYYKKPPHVYYRKLRKFTSHKGKNYS
jgi:hypothetical protein